MNIRYCVWSSARMYKSSKRRACVILCGIAVLVPLIRWRLSCTSSSIQPYSIIGNICASYENGHYDGNLCETLCQSKPSSTSCLNFDVEKEAVFSRMWMNESIVFKSIQASNDAF